MLTSFSHHAVSRKKVGIIKEEDRGTSLGRMGNCIRFFIYNQRIGEAALRTALDSTWRETLDRRREVITGLGERMSKCGLCTRGGGGRVGISPHPKVMDANYGDESGRQRFSSLVNAQQASGDVARSQQRSGKAMTSIRYACNMTSAGMMTQQTGGNVALQTAVYIHSKQATVKQPGEETSIGNPNGTKEADFRSLNSNLQSLKQEYR